MEDNNSMHCDGFAARVQASIREIWADWVLPRIREYVRVECISQAYDPEWIIRGELARAAGLLEQSVGSTNLANVRTHTLASPGRAPMVIIDISGTDGFAVGGDRPIVVYSHYDKQPIGDGWESDPFVGREVDGRIVGRGVADDGWASFGTLGALAVLEHEGIPHGRVVLLIEGAEESGSLGFDHYVKEVAAQLGSPRALVSLDGGGPTEDRLWQVTSLRGAVSFQLTVSVLDEAVHSGRGGGIVPSAFCALRRMLSLIEDETSGEIVLGSCRVEIPEAARDLAASNAREFGEAVVGEFPLRSGVKLYGAGDVARQLLLQSWEGSLAITGLSGIPSVEAPLVVLQPCVSVRGILRTPPNSAVENVVRELRERLAALSAAEDLGISRECEILAEVQGWSARATLGLPNEALTSASEAWLGRPSGQIGTGGSCPPVAILSRLFPATDLMVTGAISGRSSAHGRNESLSEEVGRALVGFLCHLCAMDRDLPAASPGG